ncbi:MAG: hypothetical protein OJJ54_14215 [Pseudonocardia sp.]|nr:hypothetical protein [Pseudonocardia sp.]
MIPDVLTPTATARSAAIADLLDALEGVVGSYRDLPERERARRCSAEAERITGELALLLSTTRSRLSSTFERRGPGG